jgi:hypothetical protein
VSEEPTNAGTDAGEKPTTEGPKPIYSQVDLDNILSKRTATLEKAITEKVKAQLAEQQKQAELSELERERNARQKAEERAAQLEREHRLTSRRLDVTQLAAGKVPSLYIREVIQQTADEDIEPASIVAKAQELAKADGWTPASEGPAPKRFGPTHGAPRDQGSPFAGKTKEQVQHELRMLARTDPKKAKESEKEYYAFLRTEPARSP